MDKKIEKAWNNSTQHGYILMLYISKGWTMQEISNIFGCTKQFINKVLKKYDVSGLYNGSGHVYTKRELLQMMNIAMSNNEGYISYNEWNLTFSPPHAQTFVRRFGSWDKAIDMASDNSDI